MDSSTETLWRTYEVINEWIRFSDAKAGAILAANGVIVGAIASKLPETRGFFQNYPSLFILLILGVISTCLSVGFAIRSLYPSLYFGEPNSLIFFAHIAKKYKKAPDFEQAAHQGFSDNALALAQIAQQVWANSNVAWKKYKAVAWAIRFLIFTAFVAITCFVTALLRGA